MNRPSWNRYFLDIAKVVATRSTCSRLSVGAVATQGIHVIGTGYNGVPRKEEHCWHAPEFDVKCTKAVHAEMNAIIQSANLGIAMSNCTMYVTHAPCSSCVRAMLKAGVWKCIYEHDYGPVPEVSWVHKWDGV